ncbi:MalY/PatB family protein [Streptomyces tsukubensis]|uniref:cysteine-S-conjugate beta-lyase n=1 Tax=Streptomyces tsukubensis TaxID=83656 RepID=A0A1V4AHA6_9ACTN|nr:MalY/PatB family protein [Streptomyces tsukubensis]OON83058.1 transcriptional regulator [Streptomyces tsukubensis]
MAGRAPYDFDTPVDRHGTWCTQWDYVEDRFGVSDLLPFTISDMDFETAPEIMSALRGRLDHAVLGYSRWRQDDFLSAIVHWYASRHATTVDPETIVYGPSVIYQLSQLLRLWSRPGDGVVVHTPMYDAFPKTVAAHGRLPRECPLDDWEELERLLALPDTAVLLLCSPHNPTGRVWTAAELDRMAELCAAHGVAVVSDEIHSDLAHAPHVHRPWVGRGGAGRWAVITSASKSFNVPALTGSFGIIGDPASRDAYLEQLKEADGLSSPAVLSLVAHIAAYRRGEPWLDALRAYLAGNLAMLAERLRSEFPRLGWEPPQAGYLAWIDLRPLAVDDDALQRQLIEVEKVAIMPGAAYGSPGHVRLNLGCPRSKAEAGVEALVRALRRLTGAGQGPRTV